MKVPISHLTSSYKYRNKPALSNAQMTMFQLIQIPCSTEMYLMDLLYRGLFSLLFEGRGTEMEAFTPNNV